MMSILAGEKFELTDYGKLDPGADHREATYAERVKDEFGEEFPGETAFTWETDYLSEQSLDYIIGVKPKG